MTPSRRANGEKASASSCFPQNLRSLRDIHSQTEFAEWLLVSQQTLSFWEKGKRQPNRRAWVVLEQRLGYTQEQLENEPIFPPGDRGVVKGPGIGRTISLPPLSSAALRLNLEGLEAENMGVAEVQRALREALREQRPVWLIVGERPKLTR